MSQIMEFILDPLRELFFKFKSFFPNLLAFIVVLAGGLATALVVKYMARRLLGAIKFDRWCDRMGLTAFLSKVNVWSTPSQTFSLGLFWLILILSVMVSLGVLHMAALDNLVSQSFLYFPRALSAVFILLVGQLLAGFLSRAVLLSAVNSGYQYSRLLGEAVHLLLTVIVLAMALEQLQLAPNIVMAAFSISFGGIVLALAIAFGGGGIPVARKMMERAGEDKPKPEGRNSEHL